jgi:hypothetical protein
VARSQPSGILRAALLKARSTITRCRSAPVARVSLATKPGVDGRPLPRKSGVRVATHHHAATLGAEPVDRRDLGRPQPHHNRVTVIAASCALRSPRVSSVRSSCRSSSRRLSCLTRAPPVRRTDHSQVTLGSGNDDRPRRLICDSTPSRSDTTSLVTSMAGPTRPAGPPRSHATPAARLCGCGQSRPRWTRQRNGSAMMPGAARWWRWT